MKDCLYLLPKKFSIVLCLCFLIREEDTVQLFNKEKKMQ